MSVVAFTIVLAVALMTLGFVLNHVYARVALVELTLNEGLPPGHEVALTAVSIQPIDHERTARLLGEGVHVFLSRNCHACQRLLEELDQTVLSVDLPLALRHVDRPRPIASSIAERQHGALHADQAELAAAVGADPLPYTIVIGPHGSIGRSVAPTVGQILTTVRDAGVTASSESVAT